MARITPEGSKPLALRVTTAACPRWVEQGRSVGHKVS